MATSELVSLEASQFEVIEDIDDLSSAHHAPRQSMPAYHEDSGEYVSAAEDLSVISVDDLDREHPQGRFALSFDRAHEHDLDEIDVVEEEIFAHADQIHDEDLLLGKGYVNVHQEQVAIEKATKKEIKAYLRESTFKCAYPHDAEALSEYAYAPTDKGVILSVKKPFSTANFKRMKGLLRRRVKPSRYAHSLSVAQTAEKMAQAYGVDPRVARIAGLLHDWDKALSPKRLRDRIAHYHLDIDGTTQINMPHVLHGPTAAAVLADEFPEFGEDVFQAIARHTVGGMKMTPLDMIVFCSDKLEPGNDVAVYRDLYDRIGQIDLTDLFMEVQREGFMYLLRSHRPLNVDAVEVWNYYCAEKARGNEEA